MAITFIQRKDGNGTGNSLAVAFTSSPALGDLLVVAIGAAQAPLSVTSVTDTLTNTYGVRSTATGNDGTSLASAIYDCVSKAAGANTVTVVVSNSGGFLEVVLWQFHATAGTWTFDVGHFSSGSADPATSGAVTTTQAVEAMVGYAGIFGTAGAYASGWTGTNTGSGNGSAYKINSATGSNTFTIAQGGVNRYAASIAGYYAATSAVPHFPVTVVDTTTVAITFHAGAHIPVTVVDTTVVSLTFHVSGHFPLAITDTTTVSALNFHAGAHLPLTIVDTTLVHIGYEGAGAHFPVTVVDTTVVNALAFHTGAHFPLTVSDTSVVALTFHISGTSTFTVGPTSPGGSTGIYSGLTATQVTMAQDGTLQSVSINWFSNAGNPFILGVYSDNAGAPGTLLATTAVGTSVVGLNTLPTTTNPPMYNGQKYWITVEVNAGIGGYFDPTGTGAYNSSQPWTGALPTNWASSTVGALTFSLYATLTSGATLHFPMAIVDTTTVAIGYHGVVVVQHFPMAIVDSTVVSLTFHATNPTFTVGPTSPGSNTGTYTGIAGNQVTMPQNGVLQSITIQWSSDPGVSFLMGVYNDNAGVPGSLIATSAVTTSTVGAPQTLPMTTHPNMLSGQKYWIALQTQAAIGGYYDTTSGLGAFYNAQAWTGALPTVWGGESTATLTFSFYATLTTGLNPIRFPITIVDSTVVKLSYEGAPKRFAVAVVDSTVVAIGFHGLLTLNPRYVSTTGTGGGTSWNDAASINIINNSANPGDVVYLAGGTYPGTIFTRGGVAGNPLYIKRASASDPLCTSAAGWQSSFDSLVTFSGGCYLHAQYLVLDGNKWNPPGLPNQWGILVTSSTGSTTMDILVPSLAMSYTTVRNVEVAGSGFNTTTAETDLIFFGGGCTISGCKLHDSDTLLKSYPGSPNVLIEYCYLFNSSSTAGTAAHDSTSPHPDVAYSNQAWQQTIFRYNVVCNSVSEAILFDAATDTASIMLIYGNIFFQGDSQGDLTGGFGSVVMEFKTSAGTPGPIYWYHNTIVDWSKGNNLSDGGTPLNLASVFKNNLFVGTSSEWPAACMTNNGFWQYISEQTGGDNRGSAQINLASNPFDQTQPHPYVFDPGVPSATPTGVPPATRVYLLNPVGYDPQASGYVNSFSLAAGSAAIGAANLSGLPTSMYGVPVSVNTDMNGNTGNSLGALQIAGPPPPPVQHFPMNIVDSSSVMLSFHGFAPVRFQIFASDTTVVNLNFHRQRHDWQVIVSDTTLVYLNFALPIQHFPMAIVDSTLVIRLNYENDGHITPPVIVPPTPPGALTVPPYAGKVQPTQVQTNAETTAREAAYSTFPQLVPPNTDSTLGGTPGTIAP